MAFIKAGLWGPQAIIDASGHPQSGATATLYLPDEVTLASLWTTSAKSVAVANPTQADIHANLHFYADPGQYRLKVNVGTVVTWLDVEVPIDPGEAAQDQDVVAAQAAAEAYADGIVAAGLATKQPLDSDLTAIAALSTTAFGRGLLILADAAAGRAAFGSVIGTDVQAHDSDLDAIAALATTAFGRALLVLADAAALRTAAGLGSAATHASTDFDAAGAASAAVTALVAGAPGALDTLNELATALADDANFATTITNALAGKQQAVARTAVKTTNYLAAAGDLVPVDTTSGAVTVTLPNAPTDKSTIAVKHIIQGGTNVVTIACAGADVFNRAGGGTSATLPYANQAMLLEYTAAGAIWSVIADDLPLSQLDLRFAPITGIPESAVTSLATDLAAKAPILAPTAVKTGNYTAAAADYVLCDTSGGIFTVTLPTAPADKTSIAVDLVASGNTLTIARGGADVFQKAGGPTSLTMNTANRVLVLQYQSSIAVWHVQDHLPAVITTKGDLLTYGTERARLPVGGDGALLGADSTQTTGLKWIPSGAYVSRVTGLDTSGAADMRGLIQAALDAAPKGSVVRLPNTGPTGKLIISSPGVSVPSNVDFEGEGMNATVLQAQDGATAFNLVSFAADAVNSRVRHMRLQGNPTNPQQALQWQRNTDCLVQFCSFDANWTTVSINTAIGGGGYGANIKCVNCGVTDCVFDGNVVGNGAIVDWVDSTSCYTERNHCVNSQGQGTWLTQAQTADYAIANRIKDNVVEVCHTGVGNISAQDTEIDGNTFLFGYSSAINTPASGPQESRGLRITNNTCLSCGVGGGPSSSVATAAILVETRTPGAVVTGNTCIGSGKAGISAQSPATIITGNTCLANGEEGITVSAGGDESTIVGNACRNNSQNGNSHGGINVSASGCTVMGNTGVDDQAPASPIVLSAGLSTGGAITSLPVTALPVAVAAGQWINLVSGTHTQTVQATAPAIVGATTITVASFTPNFAYPTSSTLTYGTQGAIVHLGSTATNTTVIGNKGAPGVGFTYISDGGVGPTIRIANDEASTTARNRYAADTAPFWKNFAAVVDTQPTAQLDSTQFGYGPGGSTALDTLLTRTAAGVWQATKAIGVVGLTGAVAGARFAGATASGAPASGTFLLGDYIIDQTGALWICTTAGTPGTWTNPNTAIPPAVGANIVAELTSELDLVGNVITTTPTTLGLSYAAPAMSVGTLYRIVLFGDMDNKATSGTFQFALKIGSQQLGQYTIASQGSSKTNQPWRITAEVMCQATGSGSTGKALGGFQARTSTDGASGITDPTLVNIDSTISNTIDLLLTMGDAGSATNIVRAKYGFIEKAKA